VIILARHGETDWNREGRYQGRRESALTDTGRAQAQALARTLRDRSIARIVSSPLLRCLETARPLADSHGLQLETDERLVEIAHGDWEGRLRAEIADDDSEMYQAWREHPDRVHFRGGESLLDVLARWRAFARTMPAHETTLVVTHDVLVRLAILDTTNRSVAQLWEPRVVNGGYAVFAAGPQWRLIEECVDAHLGDLRVDPAAQAL
jgi:phosphoserine phosphatase